MELTISISQLCKALLDMSDWHKVNNGHDDRVSNTSVAIGEKLGLSPDKLYNLKYAALIHDIGRVGIDNHILNKQGTLTDGEMGAIKEHPNIGFKIIRDILPPEISLAVLHHHEKFDGTGYPRGLSDENIPLFARIIKVADYYDALTSDRPYRSALTKENAIHMMNLDISSFDPKVYKAFLEVIHE